jgi:hypothetical protein
MGVSLMIDLKLISTGGDMHTGGLLVINQLLLTLIISTKNQ